MGIEDYSYLWNEKKMDFVLVKSNFGYGIVDKKEKSMLLISDEELEKKIITKMLENGNKIYDDINQALEMAYEAIEKQEMINFLRGENGYMVEVSQYAPIAELPDVGKILSRGIYRAYKDDIYIKSEFEQALSIMLEMSDYDVYIVCLYLASQLFKEKNKLSPFEMDKRDLLIKLRGEIERRKTSLQKGIVYPNGYQNKKAWDELEHFKNVFKSEYNLILF